MDYFLYPADQDLNTNYSYSYTYTAHDNYNKSSIEANTNLSNNNSIDLVLLTDPNNNLLHSHRVLSSDNDTQIKENNYALPIAYTLEALAMISTALLARKFGESITIAEGTFKGLKPIKLLSSILQLGLLAATPYINKAIAEDIGTTPASPDTTTTLLIASMYYVTKMIYVKLGASKLENLDQQNNEVLKKALTLVQNGGDLGNEIANLMQRYLAEVFPIAKP